MRNVKVFRKKNNFINLEDVQTRILLIPEEKKAYLNFEKKLSKAIVNKIVGYLKYDLNLNVILASKINIIPKFKNNILYGVIEVNNKSGKFRYGKPEIKWLEYGIIPIRYKLLIMPTKSILDMIDNDVLVYELEEEF